MVSALILVLGIRALLELPVRQFPKTENAIVTVTTAYYGADAATVAGFITQPLEQAISQAQGIDYLSSTSVNGLSTITATLTATTFVLQEAAGRGGRGAPPAR